MLDPRTQLAKTIVAGLMPKNDLSPEAEAKPSGSQDVQKTQESMEALTAALLNPCTTVQEAVLDSLMQRARGRPRTSDAKDSSSIL